MKKWYEQFEDTIEHLAYTRYDAAFSGSLYNAATNGKTVRYANLLIDEALAMCGHPAYEISGRNWCPAAKEFLNRFTAYNRPLSK